MNQASHSMQKYYSELILQLQADMDPRNIVLKWDTDLKAHRFNRLFSVVLQGVWVLFGLYLE